jgi:hypothetical protein
MQDTTDLKSDILSEINFNKSELSQKMFQFKAEKQLALNTYDKGLLAEIKIVSEVDNISLGNHTFNENTDSKTVPVLIYKSKQGLTKDSENYLLWLQQRLKKQIEMYSQK